MERLTKEQRKRVANSQAEYRESLVATLKEREKEEEAVRLMILNEALSVFENETGVKIPTRLRPELRKSIRKNMYKKHRWLIDRTEHRGHTKETLYKWVVETIGGELAELQKEENNSND